MSLKHVNRLRKTADFSAVRNDGRSWADPFLVLSARPNDLATSRLGFTVSKRLGNAVTRNRIRRRLKSATSGSDVKCGWDIVVIARERARGSDYHMLERSLFRLLDRANLLKANPRIKRDQVPR